MTYWQALILAIVEGLTEFIPVSSTANILLAEKFIQVVNRDLFSSFTIFIQLGAMLAVLFLFARQLWQNKQIWGKIIIAMIPTGIIGFTVYPYVKSYLQDASPLTGWVLIIGGAFFTFLDWYWRRQKNSKQDLDDHDDQTQAEYLGVVKKAPWWKMFLIGTGQATATVPGVSRSAATIFSARALGFPQLAATQFSFVLALPTIAAASGLDLLKELMNKNLQVMCDCAADVACFCPQPYSVFNNPGDLLLMLFGAAVAFIVALLTCKFFIKVLGKKPFFWWGVYRLITGIIWLMVF